MAERPRDLVEPVPEVPPPPPEVPPAVVLPEQGAPPNSTQQNVAGINRQPPQPAVQLGTLGSLFQSTRTDFRFTHIAATGSHTTYPVYFNFELLYARFSILYNRGLNTWMGLRDFLPGTIAEQDALINNFSAALSAATCYMIYNLLRSKTAHHLVQLSNRYRTRCDLDVFTELPVGLMYIAESFGFCRTTQTFRNIDYMMVWDNDNPNTFGLLAAHALNSAHLDACLEALRRLGVPMRRLNRGCPNTSAWFTLHISDPPGVSGKVICTTLPAANYTLPHDIFLAEMIMGTTSVDPNQTAIQFVGLRVSTYEHGDTCNRLQGNVPNDYTAAETAQYPVIQAGANPDLGLVALQLDNPLVHPSGVYLRQTGVDANRVAQYTRGFTLLGRGGAASTCVIDQVCRGLTVQDTTTWCEALIRKGP